jgi:hypothetical protein
MRTTVLGILALTICSSSVIAAPAPKNSEPLDPKPAEPTAEQLQAAKEAYGKQGAKYSCDTDPQTKQRFHQFSMPPKTTDAELKNLPDLPFHFGLDLEQARISREREDVFEKT